MQYVDKIAAAFVVLSGLYLAWYFYWVDLDNGGDPITDWAFARQADATAFLNDNWKVVGVVLGGVVAVAVAYVTFRKDDTDDELEGGLPSPNRSADPCLRPILQRLCRTICAERSAETLTQTKWVEISSVRSGMTDTPFDPTTVPIKAAATVMMVRDKILGGSEGLEVFMLRRTGRASFAAGMYVFPGGRVDDVDHADEIAPVLQGPHRR